MQTEAKAQPFSAGARLEAEIEYALTTGYGYAFIEDVFGARRWVRRDSVAVPYDRVIGLNEYVSSSPSTSNQE